MAETPETSLAETPLAALHARLGAKMVPFAGYSMPVQYPLGVMGEHKNIYYGTAYNGEGVAFAQTAGRIISELMAGEESNLTDLFVVNRKMPYLGPKSLRTPFVRLFEWLVTHGSEKVVR